MHARPTLHRRALSLAVAALVVAAGPQVGDAATPAHPSPAARAAGDGIAWRTAATEADVDAAFAEARRSGKPLFLYWGAVWCPPCNQVMATVFNRADFIERTRAFVPVYVDGDRPGAQKLGARYRVSGYPTFVLFTPDGTEVTRLPGEVDPGRYAEVMTLGLDAKRPARVVLAAALGDAKGLTPADWRLLAFYSWETDEQQLVKKGELASVLQRLAARCPAGEPEASARLWLRSLAARGHDLESRKGAAAFAPEAASASADRSRLMRVLADPKAVRRHLDVLESDAPAIVKALGGAGANRALVGAYDAALRVAQIDTTLSRADRLGALDARVALAKLNGAAVPRALQAEVRAAALDADRGIVDGYERQAVIPSAASLLDEAGLPAEARTLLQDNLAKSHSAYYLMTGLAEIEARHGNAAAALRWHRQAWDASVGPATRVQWGARYVRALTELAPRDEAAVQAAALKLIDEAAAQPDAFYERSARSLRRVGSVLRAWNKGDAHADVWQRFATRVESLCARYPKGDPQRTGCEAVLVDSA